MMRRRWFGLSLTPLLAIAVACSSPVEPGGPVTVTSAVGLAPTNGTFFAHATQPVTLKIANGTTTGATGSISYTFEVASDSGFASIRASRDVSETAGETSITLETMPPGNYYWHVRTNSDGTKGEFSSPMTFTIGPIVLVGTPAPSFPADGATLVVLRPALTVPNVNHTLSTGQFLYQFDVARDSAFTNVIESRTLPEGKGQTLFIPALSLPALTTVFWRVQVTDTASGTKGLPSPIVSFTTGTELTSLWPRTQPPGRNNGMPPGFHWDPQVFTSFTGVSIASPTLEMRQVFDLLARGMSPQGAIDWMRGNGYPTSATYVPAHFPDGSNDLIRFDFLCMVYLNLHWDVQPRAGG